MAKRLSQYTRAELIEEIRKLRIAAKSQKAIPNEASVVALNCALLDIFSDMENQILSDNGLLDIAEQLSHASNELADLHSEISGKNDIINQQSADLRALRAEVRRLGRYAEGKDDKLKKADKTIIDLRGQLFKTQEELRNEKEKTNAITRPDVAEQLARASNELAGMQSEISNKNDIINKQSADLCELRAEIKKADKTIFELRGQLFKTQEELRNEKEKTTVTTRSAGLAKRAIKLEIENRNLRTQNENFSAHNQTLRRSLSQAEQRIEEQAKQIQELSEQRSQLFLLMVAVHSIKTAGDDIQKVKTMADKYIQNIMQNQK